LGSGDSITYLNFVKKKEKNTDAEANLQKGQLYIQAFKSNIKNIVKIKENFSNLSAKKVEEIHKVLNRPKKDKPRLNMITKSLFRKQVLVLMSFNNSDQFMVLSRKYVANINRALKDIKVDVITDFIQADSRSLIITTNKVVST